MQAAVLYSVTVAGCTVRAVLGDITSEQVDAVVNAANTDLAHIGGLAGAIVRSGGSVIQEESSRLAPVAVGSAVATGAGSLPCRWVIHAVGPIWGEGDELQKLRSAVHSSLDEAVRLGASSLALPAISTGIFGYPKAEGTVAIVNEVMRWIRDHAEHGLHELRLTAFDEPTAALFSKALQACA